MATGQTAKHETQSSDVDPVAAAQPQDKHKTSQDTLDASNNQLKTYWTNVRAGLRSELGDTLYKNWFKAVVLVDCQGPRVTLAAPTRFTADWLRANYQSKLQALWHEQDKTIRHVDVIVGTPNDGMAAEESESVADAMEVVPAAANTSESDVDKWTLTGSSLDKRFTFDNFVVGKPNEFAYAAARRVAESDEVTFNPLFLHGGVGLGKTHLMHAIAWEISQRFPERRVVYLSAEKFMYQFIKSLRYKDMMAFKEQFRAVDVLMIDDFQFIGGKEATQEEFFHTFNALADEKRQIIISADKSPADLDGLEDRLRSRLGWGLVADIHPTTYELRLGILQAKAAQMVADAKAKAEARGAPREMHIPDQVLEFIAHKICANVRELEGALNRIIAHNTLVGGEITLESVQDLLQDMLRAANRRYTVEEIQKKVAEHFNIKLAEMHSSRRSRAVARPRQIAMYLAKALTPCSLPEIGRKFGGRDHTTVIHAVRKVEELLEMDPHLAEDVSVLKRILKS